MFTQSKLTKISDIVNVVVMVFASILLCIIFTITIIAATYKYTTSASLTWAVGVNQALLPWVAALSTTVALKYGEHIALSFLAKHVPVYVSTILRTINFVLIGIFAVLLLFYGYEFMKSSDQMIMISSMLQISGMWPAAAIPVTGAIFCIHLLAGPDLLITRDILDDLGEDLPK
ncbi:TRAP transporter small permease [Pusillimonas sp. ANT_WB101]|uniref:TRAP transporter small permease n=1 Tax=Pusillimonas sp. ANT_WB101 TaxID=2597356 RepID=UPI0011EE8E12|nr:TRAP transporter small permease subunit [Pusillimonas sp. ANT_WB101]KAA0911351.1 TRAP transporter small permease [Pusillimonas sp. ANT_WB101]